MPLDLKDISRAAILDAHLYLKMLPKGMPMQISKFTCDQMGYVDSSVRKVDFGSTL